jgi:hypothetical protein
MRPYESKSSGHNNDWQISEARFNPLAICFFTIGRAWLEILQICGPFQEKILQEIESILVMQMVALNIMRSQWHKYRESQPKGLLLWTFDPVAVTPAPRFPISRRTVLF